MTNQIQIPHSIYTSILDHTILLLRGWQHGRDHMNCQSSLFVPLMLGYCAISLISCQSLLLGSICLNTAQLHNHNYIPVCFKHLIWFIVSNATFSNISAIYANEFNVQYHVRQWHILYMYNELKSWREVPGVWTGLFNPMLQLRGGVMYGGYSSPWTKWTQ